ncbi:MAG: hypothetical protein WDZ68_00580 [Candidatus Paceibacterota bacterium]
MSDIKFNEPNVSSHRRFNHQEKGIIGLLTKHGIAKNVATANLIMIGMIVILVAIAFTALSGMGRDSTNPEVFEDDLLLEDI